MGFRGDWHMVVQLQLSRYQRAVPLTRDYLYPSKEVGAAAAGEKSYRPRRVA